ncbi:hypothetical protein ACOMHN_039381 [Nucella lapillus]
MRCDLTTNVTVQVVQQGEDLFTKDRFIQQLQDRLKIFIMARGDNAHSQNEEEEGEGSQQRIQKLERHCLILQQQVHEMESFLADYGMVWVGKGAGRDSETPDAKDSRGVFGGVPPFIIDFDLLMENIQDLNAIAEEGNTPSLQHTTSGARFTTQSPVAVTFYANGLTLAGGPFRPYSDPVTRLCVLDFLDGYFPSELQSRYPEGVSFSVSDKRQVVFQPDGGSGVFKGVGNTLGVSPALTQVSPKEGTSADHQTMPTVPPEGLTQNSKSGTSVQTDVSPDLLSVVSDVQQTVKGDVSGGTRSPGEIHADQPDVSDEVETEVSMASQGSDGKKGVVPPDTSTLRIKSESGNQTYLLYMRSTETIGHLRRYLDAHRTKENLHSDYLICSTHPRKVYTDDCATLQSCSLFPNGVLHLQAKTHT